MKAVFDYNVDVPIVVPPPIVFDGDNAWDSALWDTGRWDFGLSGQSLPIGSLGLGRAVAIGMKGASSTRVTLTGWDLMFKVGGML